MIRKKGQIIRLDTPHTTLVIKADSAEYLYYGKKLASTVGFEYLAGTPCKIFSQYGFDDYTEDDHCWFELDPETAFSETVQAPTINMTVAELVRKFGEVDGCWDDVWANVYEGL